MTFSRAEGIEVIKSADAFDALASGWPGPGVRSFGPLTSHEWFSCAARVFSAPDSLHVIVYRRNGIVAGVAPLVRATHRGLEWLELIGASALFEPASLPAIDQEALHAVCTAIVGQDRPVFLQRLEWNDPCVSLLERGAPAYGRIRRLPRDGTHFLSPGTTWAEVDAGMPARRRRQLRRARDDLNARGTVTFEALAPGPHDVAAAFATVMNVESAGWKGREGSALLVNERLRTFFGELAQKFARRGELRVFMLRLDGVAIAVQLGIEQGGRYWALKRGFDEAWRQYSPGILLTSDAIAHMLDHRHAGYEFLGVAEDWQRQWASRERPLCAVAYYPRTLRGRAAFAADSLLALARAGLRCMRRVHDD